MNADDTLFLTEIVLSNFRSFGPDARIPLDPQPGMVVVAGPNGLGKTSLLEGVEWGLTGGVRRLSINGTNAQVDRALTRRGAPNRSHRVELHFNDGAIIERVPGGGTRLEDVAEILKRGDWPAIKHVETYIAMTHFLSQSALLRLTARSPEERWQRPGGNRADRQYPQEFGKAHQGPPAATRQRPCRRAQAGRGRPGLVPRPVPPGGRDGCSHGRP